MKVAQLHGLYRSGKRVAIIGTVPGDCYNSHLLSIPVQCRTGEVGRHTGFNVVNKESVALKSVRFVAVVTLPEW